MAFNPGEFVYRPQPLQQYDMGAGFRALAEARFERKRRQQADAQLGEQKAVRADTNTRFSAGLAAEMSQGEHAESRKKYDQAVSLVNAGRKAVAQGDWNTADAMAGRIVELGGKVDKQVGPDGRPVYRFEAPPEPARAPVDFAGTRSQIFGGGVTPPVMGQPFQMRSNVGPGAGPLAGKNPFETLPGSSAASAGLPQQGASPMAAPPEQPPPEVPPPGWAPPMLHPQDEPWRPPLEQPPEQAPPGAPPPQAAGDQLPPGDQPPGGLQLTMPGRNPYDPFVLDTNQLIRQNELRLDPYLEATANAFPAEEPQRRVRELNKGVSSLGLPPEDSLKLWQQTLNTVAGQIRSETQAEATRASQGLRSEAMKFSQSQRIRNDVSARAEQVAKKWGVPKSHERWAELRSVWDNLKAGSTGNGQADVQAISALRNLHQAGVMTDKDFKFAREGIKNMWSTVKHAIIEKVVGPNGVNPEDRENLREVAKIAEKNIAISFLNAQTALLTRVLYDRTVGDEERQELITKTAEMIPPELHDPRLTEFLKERVAQKSGEVDHSGNYPVEPTKPRAKKKPVEKMELEEVEDEADSFLE